MKTFYLFVDFEPSMGGGFQYNQAIIDAYKELSDYQYKKKIFYTDDRWKKYLHGCNFETTKIDITSFQKKILKIVILLKLPFFIRKNILKVLRANSLNQINSSDIDLILFPTADFISLFVSTPKVITIHDLMHRYESRFSEVSANGRFRYREMIYNAFCKEAKALIVDSKTGIDHVVESYNVQRKLVFDLPYIPPPYILSTNEEPPVDFNERYSILPDKFLFYPAQFWGHKNHKNLIEALHILNHKSIDIVLVFAGKKAKEYNKLVVQIEEYDLQDRVFFLDYVPDEYFREIYKRARGLLMPTFFGPTNIPPLEAMYLGCPSAVSDIYGMREQLKNASLYFDPNEPKSIADALWALWYDDDKCNELILNGKKRVLEWNKDMFNDRFDEIINLVLK